MQTQRHNIQGFSNPRKQKASEWKNSLQFWELKFYEEQLNLSHQNPFAKFTLFRYFLAKPGTIIHIHITTAANNSHCIKTTSNQSPRPSAADLSHNPNTDNPRVSVIFSLQLHSHHFFLSLKHFSRLTVSCQDQVVIGFIGDAVLLPCVYREDDPLPDKVSVYWRDKDDNIVLDITNSSPNIKTQDKIFRDRVSTSPELYKGGNFSITLNNLRQSDGGLYECHIPRVDFQVKVQLNVLGLYQFYSSIELIERHKLPTEHNRFDMKTDVNMWFFFFFCQILWKD